MADKDHHLPVSAGRGTVPLTPDKNPGTVSSTGRGPAAGNATGVVDAYTRPNESGNTAQTAVGGDRGTFARTPSSEASSPGVSAGIPFADDGSPFVGRRTTVYSTERAVGGARIPLAGASSPHSGALSPLAIAGCTLAGTGSSPAGARSPLSGTTSPLAGTRSYLEGARSPVASTGTPPAGASSPLAGARSPVPCALSPLAVAGSPLAGSRSPLAGALSPVGGAENPMAGSPGTIGVSSSIPGVRLISGWQRKPGLLHDGLISRQSWPLRDGERLIIHLRPLPPEALREEGACYFLILPVEEATSQSPSKTTTEGATAGLTPDPNVNVKVVLRQRTHGDVIDDHVVLETDYNRLFTMDWTHNLSTHAPADLAALLSHSMVAAEQSVTRQAVRPLQLNLLPYDGTDTRGRGVMTSQGTSMMTSETLSDVSKTSSTDVTMRADSVLDKTNLRITSEIFQPRISQEARAAHRVAPDGSLVRMEPSDPGHSQLDTPTSIDEVDSQVSESGLAIYPGCSDAHGSRIVGMFCKHSGWDRDKVTPRELARLLLFYSSIPKDDIKTRGFTLIVDARGTTLPILNKLLETIYMVHATSTDAISIVHVLADRVAQSLLFRSPVFRPQVNIKIDLVTSVETLYKFVDQRRLPAELGGIGRHPHRDWVIFRRLVDPLMLRCRAGAQHLVSVLAELATSDTTPRTATEARSHLAAHDRLVGSALEDAGLQGLRQEGLQVLERCRHMEETLRGSDDYRETLEGAALLLDQVEEAMQRLVQLSDTRRQRLQQCLQLRLFEEQASQVVGWLTSEGEQVLTRHADVAENLRAVRQQQREFDKLYFAAMTHIEKGNDMLEEAGVLTQTGEFDDVSGIKEITHELKTRVQSFTSRLDDLKDKISNTAQCYHLLDKSYEWALDAMKYVGSMKMETTATPAGLDKVTSSLDLYLREHPPINDNTFESMLELAQQLENDKLHEQCRQAQARCHETSSLLRTRQAALRRARGRLEKEERRRASLVSAMSHSGFGPDLQEPCWQPQTELACSVQSMMALRRRSYAGQSSAPMYSPQAQAFRDGVRDNNLSEYEEQFFREGLITEDMSDRIVTSLPGTSIQGGAGAAAGRTSMDSLRASKESLRGGSSENLSREQKSSSLPREITGLGAAAGGQQGQGDDGQSPAAGTAADQPLVVLPGRQGGNQPQKKLMRRMNSVLTGAEGEVLDHQPGADSRKGKTLSLISGSSESLPSMPEEEEGDEERQEGQVSNGERKFVWSPVPVNTHLARQTRGTLSSYHSMADLRLTDEEMKRRRTLELIMNEMVQTERNYVKSLGYVIENYIPELLREDVPQPMRGKRNVIFGNLEQIHTFHSQYFLSALEQCEVTPFQICHCFLQHAQEFYLYALYNKNKPKSDELMSEYAAKFFRRKQIELKDRMDLSSYLLKPVQRMGKYALLLKQILKECPESEQEHADLKSALEMVKFQLRHGNDLLVMDSLRDCDVNLQEQGRLLRQDEFLVWTGRRKSLRRIFLFEELILFSKTRRSANGHDVYIYKNSMKTADIGLTENVGESQYKFEIWFRRRTDGATRTLQAPNMDVKAAWVREISRLLWKQAIKNRELRLQEMARMGIGSKPCLDLKQSKDNIKDRFVNLSTNRVPRSRNSIAVSSFEHLKNGTKRPHSIISVSSTSSSNSSHSSGPGLFSNIHGSNLESTSESPQRNSKSYTICSNESGIVADMGSTTPPTSTSLMTDSCTQTTLKRPPRHPKAPSSSSSSSDTVSLAAGGNTGTQTSSHMLSTDV